MSTLRSLVVENINVGKNTERYKFGKLPEHGLKDDHEFENKVREIMAEIYQCFSPIIIIIQSNY